MKKFCNNDEDWMNYAVLLAEYAENNGEIPVGAILTLDNKIIGEGWNYSITCNDPTAHAEIIAIRFGGKNIGNYRLLNTTMYVTLEPCIMCIGAIIHARIHRLVFGAYNKKYTIQSPLNTMDLLSKNHKILCTGGVLEKTCSDKLNNFFHKKRKLPIP